MKKLALFLIFALTSAFALSQPDNVCNGKAIKRYTKGQSLIVSCDTVFVMSSQTYALIQNKDSLLNEISYLKDKHLAELESNYDLLRSYFDSMSAKSETLISIQKENNAKIQAKLGIISDVMQMQEKSIKQARKEERKAKVKSLVNNGLIGLGSFSLGVTVALFLM